MAQPLNFGQLTYKQGMNTLVGAPVETYAKVGAELTDRYWKVRQGVADTKNALANMSINKEYASDSLVLKQAADELENDFRQASESGMWHTAQGTLINSISKINNNAGLKLVLASKAAKDKVNKEIDDAPDWSSEQKQSWKLKNELNNNGVVKDPTTGVYTGGFQGTSLPKYISTISVLKEASDIVGKFNPSSDTQESFTSEAKRLGIGAMTTVIDGKEMSLDAFVSSRKVSNKELSEEVVADFVRNAMLSNGAYIQSLNAEHSMDLFNTRLQTDDKGNLLKTANGQPILKPVDNSVIANEIRNSPMTKVDILYGALGEDAKVFDVKKPTAIQVVQQKALLNKLGITSLEGIAGSKVAMDMYVANAMNLVLSDGKGGLIQDDNTKAKIYSKLRTNIDINRNANSLGSGIGFKEYSSTLEYKAMPGYAQLLGQKHKKALEDMTKGMTVMQGMTVPISPSRTIKTMAQTTDALNANGLKISVAENNLKLIEGSTVENMPSDIKTNFIIKDNKDREAVIARLKTDISHDKNIQASLLMKKDNSEYELQRVFKKAAESGITSMAKVSTNVVPLNDKEYMSTFQLPSVQAGIPFDEAMIKNNIKVDSKYYKAAKAEYDNQLSQQAETLNTRMIEKGIELQDVSNLTVVDGRNNPAYQATMTQIKRQLLENSIVGTVRDTKHSDNPELQTSDTSWRDLANLNSEDVQVSRIIVEEGALGTDPGDAVFQVTKFYPKDYKEGSSSNQSPKAGTMQDKSIISFPAAQLNQDLNVQMIRSAKSAWADPEYRADASLTMEVAYKDLAASLPFADYNDGKYGKVLAIDNNRSLGSNMNVLVKDLIPGDPFKALINNTPVTITKNRDGNMTFVVMKENGITPLYQEEYDARIKQHLPTESLEPFLGRPTTASKFMAGFAAQIFQIK